MRLTAIRFRPSGGGGVEITNDFPRKYLPRKITWGYANAKSNLWGPRRFKYPWIKAFKELQREQGLKVMSRSWEDINRPPGTVAIDANEFARVQLHEPLPPYNHPWPFQHHDFVVGSREDPDFKERPALVYQKYWTLYEGLKGVSHFANAIIESEESLAPPVADIESRVTIDEKTLDMLDRRLKWVLKDDSVIQKMPDQRDFPKVNYKKTRSYGIHPLRVDFNILKAFQTAADLMIANRYGFVDRRIVDWPKAKVPFERDGHLCLLDLKPEFVATSSQAAAGDATDSSKQINLPVFDKEPETTIPKSLVDITPVHWGINFEETNFYPAPDTWSVGIKLPHQVQTVFLTTNNRIPKLQPDRFIKGRSVMFMYGIAVSQARELYGSPNHSDPVNYTDLPKPVTIQCVHYNMTKKNFVFTALQLNTLSFESENSLKNQIWTDGPVELDDHETVLRKFVAINLANANQSVLSQVN